MMAWNRHAIEQTQLGKRVASMARDAQSLISTQKNNSTMSVSMSGWSDSVSVARISRSCNLNVFCDPMIPVCGKLHAIDATR